MRNSIFKSYTKKILRSEAFISVIIVFVLALGIIGTSYALYMDVDTDTNYQLVEVGDLSIGFDNGDNTITLNNMLPQEDENAIKSSDNLFSFYIYNRGTYTIDYDIKLITEEDNTIEANYINYQICRDNSENCSDIKTLGTKNEDETVNINNPILSDSLLAKKSTDASNPSAYYFLRIWINNTYKGTETGTIKYKVEVTATNASGDINSSNTLAGTILNNAKIAEEENSTDRTIYSPEPLTKPAEEVNGENERTLSQTQDDYGTSYYFRGNVDDNYVNFAGMCWRIVRIAGDGSVKLILEDRNEQCNDKEGQDLNNNGTYFTGNWSDGNGYYFGYNSDKKPDFINYTETDGLQHSLKTFQTYLAKKIATNLTDNSTQIEINNTLASLLKIDEWCYDDKVSETKTIECDMDFNGENESQCINEYYGAYTRINTNKNPSLKCSGTKLTKFKDETDMYVGTLTADEMVFAGVDANSSPNINYYLINTYSKNNCSYWWSLSPETYDEFESDSYSFILMSDRGLLMSEYTRRDVFSRPSINLKPGTLYKFGNGKQETPYEIKMNSTEN